MNETKDYCKYSKWLREVAAKAQHPFACDSESMVKYCLDWDTKMPRKYGWRFTDMESFRKQVEGTKDSVGQVNRVYWHDMARNIEAYGVMTFWRGGELLKSAIRSLNVHNILAPAVLSRSLLELSASLIENSNLIRKNVEQIEKLPDSGVIVSHGLEEFSVRIIWGTRLDNPPEFLKQRNILNCIQRCSKHPDASDLLPVYEFLCEVAHPNVIGNARFWGKVEEKHIDGSVRIVIDRQAESEVTKEILEKILWALGWSSACLRNGYHNIQSALTIILKRWPTEA